MLHTRVSLIGLVAAALIALTAVGPATAVLGAGPSNAPRPPLTPVPATGNAAPRLSGGPCNTWVGLPDLNALWTNPVDLNTGDCTGIADGPVTLGSTAQKTPASITVPAGMTATLENTVEVTAGSSLTFAPGSVIEPKTTQANVVVDGVSGNTAAGSLSALGTASQPFQITSADGVVQAGIWGGFLTINPGAQVSLAHFQVSYASNVDGRFAVPVTIPAGMTAVIHSTIEVQAGGSLTLQPGSTLEADTGGHTGCCDWTNLVIDGPSSPAPAGILDAQGTAAQPVVMTSASGAPAPGDWGTLILNSGASVTFDHVHLSYAGAPHLLGCGGCPVNIAVQVSGTQTISNSTIDHSAGDAVGVGSGNPTLTNDTFTDNGGWAVNYITPNASLPENISATQFTGLSATGNGPGTGPSHNTIAIGTPCCGIIGTWNIASLATIGIPIEAPNSLGVAAGGTLNLAAGAKLLLLNNTDLEIGSGSPGGTLNVNGTQAAPVVVTSAYATPKAGDWGGIQFLGNGGASGTISYLQVSDGGGGVSGHCICATDIGVGVGATVTVSNSTITTSAGDGIDADGRASLTLTSDNFTNNGGWGILYTGVPNSFGQDTALGASGNGHNPIGVSTNNQGFGGAWTIPSNQGLPLEITNGDLHVGTGASLTLDAGAELLMDGGSIDVDSGGGGPAGGAITATGTAQAPVIVTSAQATPKPGDWGNLHFGQYSGPNATGTLDHVEISYGGGGSEGDLLVTGAAEVAISNSTISNSANDGVGIASANPTLTNDSFTNDAGWAVNYALTNASMPVDFGQDTGLVATGNGHNAIAMVGRVITGTWNIASGLGVPIVFTDGDYLEIAPGATMTLGAGTTLLFAMSACSRFYVAGPSNGQPGGVFTINGTAAKPVTLSSANASQQPGDWGSIDVTRGATASFNYAHISFGGQSCADGTVRAEAGSTLSISNSSIDHSGSDDVTAVGGAQPVIHTTALGPVSSGNFGVDNQSWQQGQPQVDATNDDWAAADGPSGAGPGSGTPVSTGVFFSPWQSNGPNGNATISGHVLDSTANPPAPVAGAQLQVCTSANSDCRLVAVDSGGAYTAGGLGVGQYVVYASPPSGSNLFPTQASVTVTTGGQSVSQDVTLPPATGLPPGASITGAGARGVNRQHVPTVFLGQPFIISVVAPADYQSVTYTITDPAGNVEATGPLTKATGETAPTRAGSRATGNDGINWSGVASAIDHGNGNLGVTGKSNDGALHGILVALGIYVDPSGTVQTLGGQPVVGATVTLARADSPSGPFATVPNGSAIMSPANQTNPDTTDSNGAFGWDTLAGYYTITASKAGCANTGTTEILPVPPPQTGLIITLDCPPGTPGPVLDSLTPPGGRVTGNQTTSVSGQHFQSAATVSIGGQPATAVSVSPDGTTITATAPASSDIGDVNGLGGVSATDALCILRDLAHLPSTAACPANGNYAQADVSVTNPDGQTQTLKRAYFYLHLTDVNGDGTTDATDALCILRHVARLPGTLACPAFVNSTPPSGAPSTRNAEALASGGAAGAISAGRKAAPARPPAGGGAHLTLTADSGSSRYTLSADAPASGLGSWTIEVTYDPATLKVIDCAGENGSLCNPSAAPGIVLITGASSSGLRGSQPLATISFEQAGKHIHAPAPALRVETLTDPGGNPLTVR